MKKYNHWIDNVPSSVFDKINKSIKEFNISPFYSLHQGKTTFMPLANPKNWTIDEFELLAHHHASPNGIPTLRKAIYDKLCQQFDEELCEDNITITCGATHAVGTALRSIINPGDEVLILSPQWLFANGLVYAAGGIPLEVPVFFELSKDPNFDFITSLKSFLSPKTKAIYFNNPNNPTGTSLRRKGLQKLIEFAIMHDLWIVADNAYENYDFTREGFTDIAELEFARAKTFSIYTFSKKYAMPGYRIGYVLSPNEMAERIRKLTLYSIYSVSTSSQYGAYQALQTPDSVLREYHLLARQARDIVVEQLQIPATKPEGGLYAFLDLSKWKGDTDDFIENCIRSGVSLAPGSAFGKNYSQYARLCFTATDHSGLKIAIDRINAVYLSKT